MQPSNHEPSFSQIELCTSLRYLPLTNATLSEELETLASKLEHGSRKDVHEALLRLITLTEKESRDLGDYYRLDYIILEIGKYYERSEDSEILNLMEKHSRLSLMKYSANPFPEAAALLSEEIRVPHDISLPDDPLPPIIAYSLLRKTMCSKNGVAHPHEAYEHVKACAFALIDDGGYRAYEPDLVCTFESFRFSVQKSVPSLLFKVS